MKVFLDLLDLPQGKQVNPFRLTSPEVWFQVLCWSQPCDCWNIVSLSLFYRHYFGRCSPELAELVPLPHSYGRSTHYFERLHDLSFTIPICYKNLFVNSFFPRIVSLQNSLPAECFHLTYYLNGTESIVMNFIRLDPSKQNSYILFTFFYFCFL